MRTVHYLPERRSVPRGVESPSREAGPRATRLRITACDLMVRYLSFLDGLMKHTGRSFPAELVLAPLSWKLFIPGHPHHCTHYSWS